MSTSPTAPTAAPKTPPRRHWIVGTFRTPLGILALTFLTALIALVIFGPMIWGDAAVAANPKALSQGPSSEHIFGTDAGGRDVFARTMTAARLSVLMALGAVALGVTIGLILGTLPTLAPAGSDEWSWHSSTSPSHSPDCSSRSSCWSFSDRVLAAR
ncbi:hypothetical protein ACQGFJ_26870 [Rhodococcus sp. 3.70]